MADVVIRGMEMPDRRTAELMHIELACISRECDRHCENCDLVQDRDELIVAFHEAIRVFEAVANAVQLPEWHGRLGDLEIAEAILHNKAFDLAGTSAEYNALNWAMRQIKALPTIVPAEGGKHNADPAD